MAKKAALSEAEVRSIAQMVIENAIADIREPDVLRCGHWSDISRIMDAIDMVKVTYKWRR